MSPFNSIHAITVREFIPTSNERYSINFFLTLTTDHLENMSDEMKDLESDLKHANCCLMDCNSVCKNAVIRIPDAMAGIKKAEKALKMFNSPESVVKPLLEAYESITLMMIEMRTIIEPIAISEQQVVRFMEEYVEQNGINHVSLNYTKSDTGQKSDGTWFYCSDRSHSGLSSNSLAEARASLALTLENVTKN